MSTKKQLSVSEFLEYFPIIDLPITLSENIIHEISRVNKVLPPSIIEEYFGTWGDQMDDTTEFLACCQLPPNDEYYSIVYWKASLMTYEFILATLDKTGVLIQKKVIAGVISNGSTIVQSVAKIEEDHTIHIMTGERKADQIQYDPTNSKGHYVEILPNGQLISSKDDNILWQEKNLNQEN